MFKQLGALGCILVEMGFKGSGLLKTGFVQQVEEVKVILH